MVVIGSVTEDWQTMVLTKRFDGKTPVSFREAH